MHEPYGAEMKWRHVEGTKRIDFTDGCYVFVTAYTNGRFLERWYNSIGEAHSNNGLPAILSNDFELYRTHGKERLKPTKQKEKKEP